MEGIKQTIFKFLRIDSLVENLSGYVETRSKLLKIEIREDLANVLSKGLVHITVVLFAFLFLIFFSIGLAEYFNTFFMDSFKGYWIVSGLYLAIFILFIAFRKSIDKKFARYFSELIKHKEE